MEKQQSSSTNSICPRCGKRFHCGANDSPTSCWCAALPNVVPLDGLRENGQTYQGCLCPDCLQDIIRTYQHPTNA